MQEESFRTVFAHAGSGGCVLGGIAGSCPAEHESKRGSVHASPNGVYIVQMIDSPVVAYKGEIKGLRPLPQKGSEDRSI